MSLLAAFAGVTACGHFGIELVPAAEDLEAGTGADGSGGGSDGSATADGAADASTDGRDGGPPVCDGPSCPGIYVTGEGSVGNDNNPGTSDKPVASIQRGVELALQLGTPTSVYVAGKSNGSKYSEAFDVAEGVSLYGGYECKALPCSWKRDVPSNPTIIAGTDYRGIVIGDGISRATVIDGFQIYGKGSTPSTGLGGIALTIDGAPTVRNCRIEASQVSANLGSGRSIAVAVFGPAPKDPNGPLIEGNDIRASSASEESIGIWLAVRGGTVSTATVSATISHNTAIRGGAAPRSYGIFARRTGATTVIEANNISSGPSNATGESGSWGIAASGAMTIRRNRINAGAAPANTNGPSCAGDAWCSGIRSDQGALVIESNIIRGARAVNAAAIVVAAIEGASPPAVSINGNTLDPVGNATDGISVSAAIALENHADVDVSVGKVRNNILLGGNNALRYGIYESKFGAKIHLAALDNNDFFHVPRQSADNDFAYHYYEGTAQSLTFAQMGTVTLPAHTANLNVNPKLDPSTYLLTSGSPMIDKGTATEAPTRDVDGETRPKGQALDIGADELQ